MVAEGERIEGKVGGDDEGGVLGDGVEESGDIGGEQELEVGEDK